ncbi:MAG: S9 family peptidase [Xanthomonadales bacterium]|nr:S9 family peptidase [Xanthomonadales bacterium]
MNRLQITCCSLLIPLMLGCSPSAEPEPDSGPASPAQANTEPAPEAAEADLESLVSRMAAIGYSVGATWAPNGGRIAFVSSASGIPQVWVAGPDGSSLEQVTEFEDQVGGVEWSPAGDVFAVSVAPGGGLNTQLYLVPAEGGQAQMITAGGDVNNWLGEWSDDGRYLTYSSNVAGSGGMDCWLYDSESGESRQIATNPGIGVCQLSPDGARAVAWRMQSRGNSNMFLVDLDSGDEQILTPHAGIAVAHQAEFVDDDTLLISTNIDREMIALARVDVAADGTPGPVNYIAGRPDAELAGFERLAEGRVALLWNAAGKSELQYLDLESGMVTAAPALPAEIAGGMEASPDGRALALTVSGAASPTNVWVLEVEYGTFMQVSNSPHDGVSLESLVRPELRTYTAHDGLELSGWLYRPAGVSGPGPMVLDFHGGPEGQERPSFNATIQALVLSGISVFAPNVRGSSGFGKTFVNLDNGALRFDGIRDIESTVKYVVESGLAEKGRIGIMGGSYGGYMVMAGLTEYPDLFAAGANLFGVVNFETFFANTEPWMAAISTVEYGDPVTEKELLQQLSPIHKVDRVVAPTIVLHGANDTNVPVVEAEQVVASLEERGVPVEYVLFPDEGHGWRKTENRVTSDVKIVKWFRAHL